MPAFENKIKRLLAEGLPVWGAALPDASDILAKTTVDTGIDFLWIDTEHTPYGIEAVAMVPVICRAGGCVPIVRVAELNQALIKKALDSGAGGVMVPQISDAREARLAVEYAKYPPQGSRGVSPWWTPYLDVRYEDYLPQANDETLVVVQIETRAGLENLEAICDVDGVDVAFAGPMDLSAALGHIGQISHPDVQQVLERIPARVAKCGKHSGISVRGFEAGRHAYQQGYRFINIGHMISYGAVGLTQDLQQLRQLASG